MKVYLKSKKGVYFGKGEWNGAELTVLKGSVIKAGEPGSFKHMKEATRCWNDNTIVDESCIVKKDVAFTSPSTAAQFVTKRSINGWVSWKSSDNRSLKELRGN